MHSTTRHLVVALIACASFGAASAHSMPRQHDAADFGQVTTNGGADRIVTVDATTRYVNVTNGQTVRFNIDGKSFSFLFDAWPSDGSVALSTIAPTGLTVPDVRVYIDPNPLYRG